MLLFAIYGLLKAALAFSALLLPPTARALVSSQCYLLVSGSHSEPEGSASRSTGQLLEILLLSGACRALSGLARSQCHLKGANCLKETTSGSTFAALLHNLSSSCVCVPALPWERASKPLCCSFSQVTLGWGCGAAPFISRGFLDVITGLSELAASTCCAFQSSGLFLPAHKRALPACSEESVFVLGSSSGR